MELVTPELAQALRANWRDQSGRRPPALKLFSPYGAATWLIHSAEPSEPDRLFGLSALTANDDLLLTYLRYNSDRRSLVPPRPRSTPAQVPSRGRHPTPERRPQVRPSPTRPRQGLPYSQPEITEESTAMQTGWRSSAPNRRPHHSKKLRASSPAPRISRKRQVAVRNSNRALCQKQPLP